MMTTMGNPSRRLLAALATAVALTVTACTAPPTGKADYRDSYPLKPEKVTSVLVMDSAAFGAPSNSRDMVRLRHYVGDYLRRGRSRLTISFGAGGKGEAALGRTDMIRAMLLREGVNAADIEFKPNQSKDIKGSDLVFSFRGYIVRVPECGDWSGAAGYDPSNLPHTDFGCSYQRNTGLMLADPGDLVEPRAPALMDARRSGVVLKNYRAGTATGAAKPTGEVGAISKVK